MGKKTLFNTTSHQKNQIKVIDQIEKQVNDNSLKSSIMAPVKDYNNDRRRCLTSVHLPNRNLIKTIQKSLIKPLQKTFPGYYYEPSSLHLTIKNIRMISDPPNFINKDVKTVKKVFDTVIPKYHFFSDIFLPATDVSAKPSPYWHHRPRTGQNHFGFR